MNFPQLDAEALSGRKLSFPRDFARTSVVIVAFDINQRSALESWVPYVTRHVEAQQADGYVIVALAKSMQMMSGMIVKMMQAAVPAAARDYTLPLFIDVDAFCASLALADHASLAVFAVTPDGAIVAQARGAFTPETGALLDGPLGATA